MTDLTTRIKMYLAGTTSEYLDHSDGCDLLMKARARLMRLSTKIQQLTHDKQSAVQRADRLARELRALKKSVRTSKRRDDNVRRAE